MKGLRECDAVKKHIILFMKDFQPSKTRKLNIYLTIM